MAFPTYSTGTVTVSAGGTTVSLSGGSWSSTAARAGDDLVIAGHTVVILDVPTSLTATIDPWPYDAATSSAYKIIQRSPLRISGRTVMDDVNTMVAGMNTDGFYFFVKDSASAPDESYGNEGQYARKPTTGEEWIKLGGVWSYLGASGNVSFDTAEWDATKTYSTRVLVPRGGKIWLSLQANNLNHAPELSPTYWRLYLSGGDAYDIANFDTDRPASGEDVLEFVFTKNIAFYAGMTDSRARAKVGATLSAVYSFKKNGVQFATMTFAAGGQAGVQTATFACAADTAFVPGDVLSVTAPATRDATLSGIAWTVSAYRT
jgi:hypothetical protein